jgi:hypothetical protein
MSAHHDKPCALLPKRNRFRIVKRVRKGDLHLYMLARLQASDSLPGVQWRWRAENNRLQIGPSQHLLQLRACLRNPVAVRDLTCFFQVFVKKAHYFGFTQALNSVQMLHAKRTGTRDCDFQRLVHASSNTNRPYAVFDAGT